MDRNRLKLLILAIALILLVGLFIVTPGILEPALLACMFATMLEPGVIWAERQGTSRRHALILFFTLGFALFSLISAFCIVRISSEWHALRSLSYLKQADATLSTWDEWIHGILPFLPPFANTLQDIQKTLLAQTPTFFTSGFLWLLLTPAFTFMLLDDGSRFLRLLFNMVPNPYFETSFAITRSVLFSIASYIRAKILEAFLVGLMVSLGLIIMQVPYALVLGMIAGCTNIVPYLGPLLGVLPVFIIALVDTRFHNWSIASVYLLANCIDMFIIFPIVVAKLVRLHPLLILSSVALGQKYGGLLGMILSVPLASTCKILLEACFEALYVPKKLKKPRLTPPEPLLQEQKNMT